MTQKNWKLKELVPKELLDRFPELSPLVVQLLYNRGLINEDAVEQFLNPQYEHLHSPFIFRDMQKAVDRIWQAVEQQEKIFIYADYDADAVTANAVLQQTFRYLGVPVFSYIPDRFTEGYGLNVEAFQCIKQEGATLVITVDCGTNSVDVADFCRANGIDLIITDHHEITGKTPESYALINPKNPVDVYPDNQITGVGVAYKLTKALLSSKQRVIRTKQIQESEYVETWDKWLLDLVSIGTVADCHSLMGENRVLVGYGLKVMKKTKWLGLRKLMELAGTSSDPDTYTIGFGLAPRINAAGRLEHANVALQLLVSEDSAGLEQYANQLEQINKRRQDLTMRVVSEAKEQAEFIADRKILLVAHSEWPKGVVGLAAGRLAELYKRPVIVLETGETESTGSARTGSEFNIIECLKSCSHLMVKFGGHTQAAGLTVKNEQVEVFYQAILDYAENNMPAATAPTLELEAELTEESLSLDTAASLQKFEPCGIGNPKPKFLLSNCNVISFRGVGKEQQHLQLQLGIGSTVIDSIGFNMGNLMNRISVGAILNVAAELMVDSWNGRSKVKLRLVDVDVKGTLRNTN